MGRAKKPRAGGRGGRRAMAGAAWEPYAQLSQDQHPDISSLFIYNLHLHRHHVIW